MEFVEYLGKPDFFYMLLYNLVEELIFSFFYGLGFG